VAPRDDFEAAIGGGGGVNGDHHCEMLDVFDVGVRLGVEVRGVATWRVLVHQYRDDPGVILVIVVLIRQL